jgi:hypothetical protein
MDTPELKQFADLTPSDFDRHPVWVGCHTVDCEEQWYDDTDEETFRPWNGALPVSPSEGMFLVRATMELADGTRLPGFATPAFDEGDLGMQQPQVFVGSRRFGFWGGLSGVPHLERQDLYTALGKPPDRIFPLRFAAAPELAIGVVKGEVSGFYRLNGDNFDAEH